ncbi:MAG: hypothetical protein K9M54_00915 [Kiritimatiellales bacterium]|nr:hypothetical protein [Kiritimatiellales bacterium]MCF7864133.1 hypothetical protein [Kiritimatiellales bacterium]
MQKKLSKDEITLLTYFAETGPTLLRPAQGILHHPSVSPALPGKCYGTQLWDWDTLWTVRGLFALADRLEDESLRQRVCRHAQGSFFNFFDYQSDEGRLPIMLDDTNPDFFGCLAKDNLEINQAKPVFAQIALLIADASNDVQWLDSRFDGLLRFYESWIARYQAPLGLLVWGNDVAVAVDNDPAIFGRPPFSAAGLMLNCLYYQDLLAAAELAGRLGRAEDRILLSQRAQELGKCIQKYCWDRRDGFYYTVDVQCVDRRAELIPHLPLGMDMEWQCLPLKVQSFAGFMPLWCGLATEAQAEILVRQYLNDASFHAACGVRSLSAEESMYSLEFSGNPSNWLGPVWVINNYVVWKGLHAYGFKREADELAAKTIHLLASDLALNGTLHEYYHPDTGEPLSHAGFMDWNLLVLEMLPT